MTSVSRSSGCQSFLSGLQKARKGVGGGGHHSSNGAGIGAQSQEKGNGAFTKNVFPSVPPWSKGEMADPQHSINIK